MSKTTFSILPYIKGTTNHISRILNKYNIQIPQKIGLILRNPKDQRLLLSSAGGKKYLAPVEKYTLEKPEEWLICV